MGEKFYKEFQCNFNQKLSSKFCLKLYTLYLCNNNGSTEAQEFQTLLNTKFY
jgi:hypothetical protein